MRTDHRRWLGALVSWLWLAGAGHAHPLPHATAQITLRDGQVEVRLRLDPLSLLEPSARAALEPLAFIDEATFAREVGAALAQAVAGARLTIDGRALAFARTHLPTAADLADAGRRTLMAREVDPGGHPATVEVLLEARLTGRPGAVALALPPAVGPALVSLIEPQYRYVEPSKPAQFAVARPEGP